MSGRLFTSVFRGTALQRQIVRGGGQQPVTKMPNGFLFGEKPSELGPRKWEDWEKLWVFGFLGTMAIATIVYPLKPDTDPAAAARRKWLEREAAGEL
eukprot:Nk52_evm1s1109 gene=Nk52_evmTU1s1109